MCFRHPHTRALLAAFALVLVAAVPVSAGAAPSSQQVQSGRADVDRAVKRLAEARERQARVAARLEESSARLDLIIAEQDAARLRLTTRARAMYREGKAGSLTLLLTANSLEEFDARWLMLTRMNLEDAKALVVLEASRAKARAASAELLRLQAEAARSADAISSEVARSRKQFASDQTALAAYQDRASATPSSQAKRLPAPLVKSNAAWQTATASHYGLNFSGRGASGEKIGPYSMICAHRTLPFGTLVEFEYGGKRAVARVADRGPHVAGRTFDLGPGVARVLGFSGVHTVRYRVIGK